MNLKLDKMIKAFKTTISSYNDPRLKNISWWMHSDPTEDGVLGYFDENHEIVPIPLSAPILQTFRPKSNTKLINLPIAVATCGLAEDCERETWTGLLTFPLRITKTQGEYVSLLDFFKAIYDFYHYPITEKDYVKLIHLKKKKEREDFFNSLQIIAESNEIDDTKCLYMYFAGSMYFEGYDHRSRSIEYGT